MRDNYLFIFHTLLQLCCDKVNEVDLFAAEDQGKYSQSSGFGSVTYELHEMLGLGSQILDKNCLKRIYLDSRDLSGYHCNSRYNHPAGLVFFILKAKFISSVPIWEDH